jgi:hypothetical protein
VWISDLPFNPPPRTTANRRAIFRHPSRLLSRMAAIIPAVIEISLADALADLDVTPPPDAVLRDLGLITDCAVCGAEIRQRTFGRQRITCSGRCRKRRWRARRRAARFLAGLSA